MHNVLSIRPAVAYGHVRNSSATFPLQRAGVNVYPVYTVTFSNHTGYGSWRGPMIMASDVADVVTGIDEWGAPVGVSTVLADYLGSVDMGQVVLDVVALVKSCDPDTIFLADPVMGDAGRGFHARPGIPEFFRDHVVAVADIMTPNLSELRYLMGHEMGTLSEMAKTTRELRGHGPEIVVVTLVVAIDAPDGLLQMLAVGVGQAWLVEIPMLEHSLTGSGDLITAMSLVHWLRAKDLGGTLGVTASVVYSILGQTSISRETELQLVTVQEQVADPVNGLTTYSPRPWINSKCHPRRC